MSNQQQPEINDGFTVDSCGERCFLMFQKDGKNMNKIDLPHNWVCDGRELKPKSGATSSSTWILNGRELCPKQNARSSNTWLWDGRELKPKQGALSSNTWIVDGRKIKPKSGANSSNTYEIGDEPILVVAGQLIWRLW